MPGQPQGSPVNVTAGFEALLTRITNRTEAPTTR